MLRSIPRSVQLKRMKQTMDEERSQRVQLSTFTLSTKMVHTAIPSAFSNKNQQLLCMFLSHHHKHVVPYDYCTKCPQHSLAWGATRAPARPHLLGVEAADLRQRHESQARPSQAAKSKLGDMQGSRRRSRKRLRQDGPPGKQDLHELTCNLVSGGSCVWKDGEDEQN